VVGYWAISGTDQNHVWAEFYLENIGWIPVDPTIGQSQPAKHDYYFGSMDNQRVILSKGFNIPLNPPTSNSYVTPLMQTFAYFFWGSSGDANTVGADRTLWNVTPNP
jgi:transglutaminase-like putative cysteine protease